MSILGCSGSDPGTDAGDIDGRVSEIDSGTGVEAGVDSGMDVGTDGGAAAAAELRALVESYEAAHPGNGGLDWDIHTLTPAEVAADPDAARLLAACGDDRRSVYPLIAWEYGGSDHQWISPEASALCYCVYIPVVPSTDHWSYEPAPADHVTADVSILFPDENPCRDDVGADRVLNCLGDPTNIDILVDTASFHDGTDVGLALSEATTELRLLSPDGTTEHLYDAL